MNWCVHITVGIISSTATISDSVVLHVLRFCFLDCDMGNPLPKDSLPPLCPHMFGWTACDPLIHHFNSLTSFVPRVRGRSFLPLRYFMRCSSLPQSSVLGSWVLVIKNDIAVPVLGCALLVANSTFAMRLWNNAFLGPFNLGHSVSTVNRSFGAALGLMPFELGIAKWYSCIASLRNLGITILQTPLFLKSSVMPKYLFLGPRWTFIAPKPSSIMCSYSDLRGASSLLLIHA